MSIITSKLNTLSKDAQGIVWSFLTVKDHANIKASCKNLFATFDKDKKFQPLQEAGSYYKQWQQLKAAALSPLISLPTRTEIDNLIPYTRVIIDDAVDNHLTWREYNKINNLKKQGVLYFSDLETGNQTSLLLNSTPSASPQRWIGKAIKDSLVFYATPFPKSGAEATSEHRVVIVNTETRTTVKVLTLQLDRYIDNIHPQVILGAFIAEQDRLMVITNKGDLYQFNAKTYQRLTENPINILPEAERNQRIVKAVYYHHPFIIVDHRFHSGNFAYRLTYFSLNDSSTGLIHEEYLKFRYRLNSHSLLLIDQQRLLHKISLDHLGTEQAPQWILRSDEMQLEINPYDKRKFSVSDRYVAVYGATIPDKKWGIVIYDITKEPQVVCRFNVTYAISLELYKTVLMMETNHHLHFLHIPTGCKTKIKPEGEIRSVFIQDKNDQRTLALVTSKKNTNTFSVQSVTTPVNLPRSQTGIPLPLPRKSPPPPKPLSPLYRFIRWIRSTSLAQMIWKVIQYIKENGSKCFCCKKTTRKI